LERKNFILISLAFVMFTHIMDSMIMMPLGDIFMKEFSLVPFQFTIIVGAYALGAFFSNIAGIFLLDQFDRRKALIFVYSGFLIGTFACGLCDSYFSLVVVRFLTGIFGGLNGSLVYSIVSDTFPYKERGKAMGGVMAGFSAAAALGVPLGLLVSYQLVWNYAFFFIALFGLPILMFVIFGFPPLTKHLKGETQLKAKQRISFIVKDRNQINALILGCVLVFGHMIIIPFIAPYMTRNIGFTDMQLILMYLIGGSVTVFSSPIFGNSDPMYMLRLSETYLILAEALCRNEGDYDTASDYINALRSRAGLADVTLTAGNFEELILQERRAELCYEGAHRWLDLKRTGKDEEVLGEYGYTTTNALWPFPEEFLESFKSIEQNDGY